jgi:ABC-type Fe3+/spermidine/putrescine transport system ATPase subunit
MISLQEVNRYYEAASARSMRSIISHDQGHEFVAVVGPSGCGKVRYCI